MSIQIPGENVKINITTQPNAVINDLNDGEVVFDCELNLLPSSITPIEIHNLNGTYRQQVDFGILQVHVEYGGHNISLSYNRTLIPGYFQTGTHLGLIIKNEKSNGSAQGVEIVYIHNNNWDTGQTGDITVMIAFVVYYRSSRVPMPGGCNLEYPMVQDAPIIIVHQYGMLVQVDIPLASAAHSSLLPSQSICDSNNTKYLLYEYRYMLLPSDADLLAMSQHNYFNYIRSMLTTDEAQNNGQLVCVHVYRIPIYTYICSEAEFFYFLKAMSQDMLMNRQSFLIYPERNILLVTIVHDPNSSDSMDGKRSMATYVPTLYSVLENHQSTEAVWCKYQHYNDYNIAGNNFFFSGQ